MDVNKPVKAVETELKTTIEEMATFDFTLFNVGFSSDVSKTSERFMAVRESHWMFIRWLTPWLREKQFTSMSVRSLDQNL